MCQEKSQSGQRDDARSLLGQLTGFREPDIQTPMSGFSLDLGDGSRWWIAGSPYTSFIAKKMGTIMELEEGDPEDCHLMFFYDRDRDYRSSELTHLLAQGWINIYQKHFQIFFHPKLHHVLCEYDPLSNAMSLYALMSSAVHAIHWGTICRRGLPFHATLLEYQGQGVLLAATGGTGKSTCSRRVPPPWRAICDDEVLVVLSPEGKYLAHPFPTWADYFWNRSEKTWKVEEAVPLAGIFFIEQALEDDCSPLEGAQAAVSSTYSAEQIMFFQFLCESDTDETREVRRLGFANACDIIKQVPAFRLGVSLTGRFWEKIEAALDWR